MPKKRKFRFTHKKQKSKAVREREQKVRDEETKFSYLKEIYFNPKSPVAFSTLPTFFKYVKKEKGSKYSLQYVKKFLQMQDEYTLHRLPKRPKYFSRIISPKSGYMLDSDVGFFPQQSKKNKSGIAPINKFLISIDLFSRFAFAAPLASLQASDVYKAMKSTLNIFKNVKKIRTDGGQEYHSNIFKNLMNENNIEMVKSFPPRKSSMAERIIKTIKGIAIKLMRHKGENDFTTVLSDALDIYNFRPHHSLPDGLSPNEARQDKYRGRIQNYLHDQHLKKMGPMKSSYKYHINSPVRIEIDRGMFSKEHEHKFSTEIYFIRDRKRRDNVDYYYLKTGQNEIVEGAFLEQELSPVTLGTSTEHKILQVYPETRRVGKKTYKAVQMEDFPDEKIWLPESDIFDL